MKLNLKVTAGDNMAKLSSLKITYDKKHTFDRLAPILEFLNDNYEILINSFDTSKSVIRSKKKQYNYPITIDDIALHLHSENIAHNDTILRKILRSPNYTKTYNPVTEYFKSIRGKYKGESHIDILSNHLIAKDFGDKSSSSHYQKRLNYLVKKWIVATAATATGKYNNPVALGLLHFKEGIGKSFFFRFIIPGVLKDFLCEFDPNKYDIVDVFAKNFLVLFDELIGINKRTAEIFKNAIQKEDIETRIHHNSSPVFLKRIASAAFTSNKTSDVGGFLSMNMGFRRFGCVELEDIKQEYSSIVDIDQVWAEALVLIDGGYSYVFDMNDFGNFQEYNSRYLIETPAMKIIKLYYSHPENGIGEWKQASEILHDLVRSKKVRGDMIDSLSPESIGYALKQLKFDRKSIRVKNIGTRYMYNVNPIY